MIVTKVRRIRFSRTRPTWICLLGDIQYGVPECRIDLLQEVVERIVSLNAYVIGTGDYVDVGSPSTISKARAANFYSTVYAVLDEKIGEFTDELSGYLGPTRGRWLGMVSGHHNWVFQDGTSVDTRLSAALCAPYLSASGLIVLRDMDSDKHEIQILVQHGHGSGQTPGSILNKLRQFRMSFPTVDIFAVGHHHRRVAGPERRLVFVTKGKEVIRQEREVYLVYSGSFLDSYYPAKETDPVPYQVQKMMIPVALGPAWIRIERTDEWFRIGVEV